MVRRTPKTREFDAAYYRRYYGNRGTRVADAKSTRTLATFVCSYLKFLQVEVREIVDLGCGLGHWRSALAAHFPRARYTGVEYSQYLCDKLGWRHGSAVDYAHDRPADLVVCQGVLQYLDAKAASAALANLGRLTGTALFLEALTQRDWEETCDRSVTDGDVFLRPVEFYRRRLKREFAACGGGVFVKRDAGVNLFDLERND